MLQRFILFRAEGRAKYCQSTTASPSRASQANTGDVDLLLTTEMDMKNGESSASAALAKDSAPPGNKKDSKTNGQDSSTKQLEFAEMLSQITACGRTSQVRLAQMTAKTLRKYCDALPLSGTTRLIRPSTPSGSESLNVAVECFSSQFVMESPREPIYSTLAGVLESQPDKRYNLSAKAGAGIVNRAEARGRELPPLLKAALELLIANTSEDTEQKT